ncbi:lectin-like [Latimeria chalumnae]|uniref:lectin-like n=1 Tax=Latimeria chalumnae TaxID=7897 RepID=UPI00313E87A5
MLWKIIVLFLTFVLYVTGATIVVEKDGCDIRDRTYDGYCYQLVTIKKSWGEAEFHCQRIHDGHLASVHSADENQIIADLIGAHSVWIGGHDLFKDRSFSWTDGSKWDFQNWHSGEPNNYLGQREACVEFNFDRSKMWNDSKCFEKHSFMCKYKKKNQLKILVDIV